MDQRDKRNPEADVAAAEEELQDAAEPADPEGPASPEEAASPADASTDPADEAADGSEGSGRAEDAPSSDEVEAESPVEPEAEPTVIEPEVVSPEAAEVERLNEQLSTLQARLRAVSKAYTDLQAENRSFRERLEAQMKMKEERHAFNLAKAFFDPVMNLKRSILSHGDDLDRLVEGLKMVHHQFMVSLEGLGMQEVPGVGADFDPNVHEALAVAPVADKSQDGKVLVVHSDGYLVKGKVLQAAQVVIGKYQEPAGEA